MKRWLWLLIPLVAGALALAWFTRATPVALVQVTRGEAIDAVFATGTVEPEQLIPVAPRVGGRLTALLVDEGQTVRKGQVLARLETAELDAQAAELAARQQQVHVQLTRTEQLVAQKFLAASELDRVRAERDAVQAQAQRVQAQRGYTQLLAPRDALVLRRDGEVGQFVVAGQALLQLGDTGRLRVSAEVDEEDIPRVKPGMPVVLRAPALGALVFDGTVSGITPRGDPVARSYRVRIALAQVPSGLRVGMTVDANLIEARRGSVLRLPASAVDAGQAPRVWQVVDGRAHAARVSTGASGNGWVEIRSGLAADARVIDKAQGLREGQRVAVR